MHMIDRSTSKIMLLDDDPFMLRLHAHQLATLGFTSVSTHSSGVDALAALDGTELILLDLNMPEMDGIEFVHHLVERHYAGGVVLISGEDNRMLKAAGSLIRAHRIELLGHVQKPVTPEVLNSLLGNWKSVASASLPSTRIAYEAQDVRAAIANGELVNYYQPKVAVPIGTLVGVETLVRWKHPVDGIVFPDQFIGIAEANGLIDDLTCVVLRGALRQAQIWRDAGLTLQVAVNLSMNNLAARTFADFVSAETAMAGISTSSITLELTESRLAPDLRAPLEVLSRLRLKRFRLSIDDFGTGHSSLVQLRDLAFDELKIDRGFIHSAHVNSTLSAICVANVSLARDLGIEVVAEGVEDKDDWDFLRKIGCDMAQGYFIARPMPAAELPNWINTWGGRQRAGDLDCDRIP